PNGLVIGSYTILNPMNTNPVTGGCGFITKISQNSNYIWLNQNYGKIGAATNGGISIKPNGNISFAGFYRDTVVIANDTLPCTYQDIFIAEVDSNGNSIMANRLGCTGDKTEVTCITTHGNDIYVAGDFQGQLLGPS